MKNGNEMSREELISALENAFDSCAKGTLKTIDNQEVEIATRYEKLEEKLYKNAKGGASTAFKWFLIGYLGFGMPAVMISTILGQEVDAGLAIAFIIGIILPFVVKKRAKKKLVAISTEKNQKIDEFEEQRNGYIHQHSDIFGFMPDLYVNSYTIAILLNYVNNMRADNLKEAINLFEQERTSGII